jgi:glycosyltransferase involved in cell wall biosynthesis
MGIGLSGVYKESAGGAKPIKMPELAIVIPAFKKKYFKAALDSLAAQTNKNFNLYIGDDHSPEDLESISKAFVNQLNLTFVRFSENMGGKDLVEQWSRCISLTKNENWLWLFSDDDIADENCVMRFYSQLEKNGQLGDVYRFNTVVIDENGNTIADQPESPDFESSATMAYHLLHGKRGNSMPDHIFSREIYLKCGGFVKTEFAQAADWASSINFSQYRGMTTIPGARVSWRYSKNNVSSTAVKQRGRMLRGHLRFIQWTMDHFAFLKLKPEDGIDYEMMRQACVTNLKWVLFDHYGGYGYKDGIRLMFFMHHCLKLSYKQTLKELYYIKIHTNPAVKNLFKPLHFIKNL